MRLGAGKDFLYDRFVRLCAAICRDARIDTVLVHVKRSFRASTVAALEEVRSQLHTLKEAGKHLVFFASDYTDRHLYLASACHSRIIHPLGSLRCTGLARTNLFFKHLVDRYGIRLQVVRRGKYKSAMDQFRLDTIDPANLEQYQRYLDASAAELHETILAGYGKSRDELDSLLRGALLDADVARDRGWVDRVLTLDSLRSEWREGRRKQRNVKVPRHIGRGKRIAVLTLEGLIVEGESNYNPLTGQSVGSASFVKQVESLRKNRRIRAVVVRVNSGGGSAIASEDVRRALARLADEKPLVVSMAEVAGSGGYWIAMTGARVFARSTTLTGSIGVINLVASVGKALADRGVTHSVIKTHEHADAVQGLRSLTDEELEELDRQVGSVYDRFLRLVGESRSLERADVEERAQGRVWAGADAHVQRLVDRVGGLTDAIDEARNLAGLKRARVDFFPRVRYSLLERMVYGGAKKTARVAAAVSPASVAFAGAQVVASLVNRPLLIEPTALFCERLFDEGLVDLLDVDLEVE